MIIKPFISFLVLFSLIGEVCSQSHPILDNFFLVENNGKVILNWTIKSGSTCNGVKIHRSDNNEEFTEIGSIDGVCGNTGFAQPYSFTDNSPLKNKTNYYKLELGLEGYTSVLSVEIIDVGIGYQVRPNPAKDNTRIYFSNNNKEESSILLIDHLGNEVLNEFSVTDHFDLDVTTIQSGVYVFVITVEEKPVSTGKIVIIH